MTEVVSGNPLPGACPAGDILKDGFGDVLGAQLSLIDLHEAIWPPGCEECGHGEKMFLGNVEHCLLEAQDAIRQVEPGHQHQWTQKLFMLLYNSREEFHSDWVEGLQQCPRKGWAGEVLGHMKGGRIVEAWGALLIALRGEADDGGGD